MISVSHIIKDYAEEESVTRALDDVSFEIEKGEFVSVMGPSGSGKSTLLNILSFLERPSEGIYTFMGRTINELSDIDLARIRNHDIGFIFQSFNLMGRASVYENVQLPLLYSEDIPVSERQGRVEKAITSVGLKQKIFSEAGALSGGQKQRVAIARALINDPNVIFADEPTGNLDSKSGGQVMEILDALHEEGKTIILVTHETYTAEFGQRLLRLKDGKLESDAPIIGRHEKTFFK